MAENILTVENLNIAYQGVPAVMDVNFTLERGKVLDHCRGIWIR